MAVTRTLRAVKFAAIREDKPTQPGNTTANAWVENWAYKLYGLLKFDLSQIPANATILSAYLRWRMYDADDPIYEREGTGTLTIRANRITSDWQETVTWNTKPTFTSQDAPSVTDAFNQPGQFSPPWDVTKHVQDMVSGAVPNYGWLFEMTNYGGGVAFYNYGYTTKYGYTTELVITYIAPSAATTKEPAGTPNAPGQIIDRVSGFDLVAQVESQGNEPIRKLEVEIYDADNNLGWETAVEYNILSVNQSSVETDTTGFTSIGGASLARDTNNAFHGNASLKVSVTNADNAGVYASATAEPGKHYSGVVRLRADSGTPTVKMLLQVKNSSGTVIASKATPAWPLYSGYHCAMMGLSIPPTNATNKNLTAWQIFTLEDVEAPADAATVEIAVVTVGAQTATWYMDAIAINPDAKLAPWIATGNVAVQIPSGILQYGKVYGWRARATNAAGNSGWTPLAYFQCVMSKEVTPTLQVIPAEGLIRLILTQHPAENLAGYRVYRRKQGATAWEKLLDLVTGLEAEDLIAASGQTYEYIVAAVAVDGYESPPSDPVSGLLVVDTTFIGDIALEHMPTLESISRPFVGQAEPVLGSIYMEVQSQESGREFELECWVKGREEFERLEALLKGANKVRYLDPFGEAFYFRVIGDINVQKWPREELYNLKTRITEVA